MKNSNENPDALKTLQDRVAYALKLIGGTYDSLSKTLGVNRNTIMAYKKGKGDPKGVVIENLVLKYKFSPSWLLTGEGDIYLNYNIQDPEMAEEPIKSSIRVKPKEEPSPTPSEKQNMGERIKNRRKVVGETQESLAKKMGVSTTTVQNYESGRPPKGDNVVKLAQWLQCSLDWLLTGEGPIYGKIVDSEDKVKTISPPQFDTVLLSKILAGVDSWLPTTEFKLSSEEKSVLISIVYELFSEGKGLFTEEVLNNFLHASLKTMKTVSKDNGC